MKHFRVAFEPDGKEISIHQGATLVEAAGLAGIVLNTSCGGRGTCGKCVVRLGADDREVLACQQTVQSDLTVTVPAESRFYAHKILEQGVERTTGLRRTVVERYRTVAGPTAIYGVAVDIGTTTVVAKLIDLADGRSVATRAMLNPQTQFGDDVVSRISYAESEAGLARLRAVIVDGINELIQGLCDVARIDATAICEASIVGNTTMNHIFLGFPVRQLGQAPYLAHSVDAHDVPPGQVGLRMNPAGNIHAAENIAGFLGSDTTAVALAVDMDCASQMILLWISAPTVSWYSGLVSGSMRPVARPARPWKGRGFDTAAGRPKGRSRPLSLTIMTSLWMSSAIWRRVQSAAVG